MSVDLNHARLATTAQELAHDLHVILVLGGYHDETTRTNVCTVLGLDLVLNPAFSQVTADFRAAHLEARRALYASTVFCNFAVFGGSCLETPEKEAPQVDVPADEERLELAELPVFAIRAERDAWDARAHRRFIQSTRR